jgi:hypothetical protein
MAEAWPALAVIALAFAVILLGLQNMRLSRAIHLASKRIGAHERALTSLYVMGLLTEDDYERASLAPTKRETLAKWETTKRSMHDRFAEDGL